MGYSHWGHKRVRQDLVIKTPPPPPLEHGCWLALMRVYLLPGWVFSLEKGAGTVALTGLGDCRIIARVVSLDSLRDFPNS